MGVARDLQCVAEALSKQYDMIGGLTLSELVYGLAYLWQHEQEQREKRAEQPMEGEEPTRDEVEDLHAKLDLAELAYETETATLSKRLRARGWELRRAVSQGNFREPAHFVATSPDEIIISIRGTAELQDALTDSDLVAVEVQTGRYGHRGMAESARNLMEVCKDDIEEAISNGLTLSLTGHSLGAGTAALAAILIREKRVASEPRAYCYAAPAVVDKQTAESASEYIFSVVVNDDFVPRAALQNVRELRQKIRDISQQRLEERRQQKQKEALAKANNDSFYEEAPAPVIEAEREAAAKAADTEEGDDDDDDDSEDPSSHTQPFLSGSSTPRRKSKWGVSALEASVQLAREGFSKLKKHMSPSKQGFSQRSNVKDLELQNIDAETGEELMPPSPSNLEGKESERQHQREQEEPPDLHVPGRILFLRSNPDASVAGAIVKSECSHLAVVELSPTLVQDHTMRAISEALDRFLHGPPKIDMEGPLFKQQGGKRRYVGTATWVERWFRLMPRGSLVGTGPALAYMETPRCLVPRNELYLNRYTFENARFSGRGPHTFSLRPVSSRLEEVRLEAKTLLDFQRWKDALMAVC